MTLPTDEQILVTREFDAPKHLVYKAWTTPEFVKRWWSGGHGEVTIADNDLRVGGRWRYVLVGAEGMEVAFHGDYREVVPNERIVTTEIYEGMPEPPPAEQVLNIVTFTETDGRTKLEFLVQAPNKDVRDQILNSGMDAAVQGQMDLLEEIAVSLS